MRRFFKFNIINLVIDKLYLYSHKFQLSCSVQTLVASNY